MIRLYEKFSLVLLLFIGVGLAIPLMTRGFIYDELHLATHYVLNPHFWSAMKNDEPMKNHLGYTILAHYSYMIFGRAEWAFRLPALLIGLGNIVLLWYFSRKIWGPGFALVAAALMTFSPPNIIWSASARGYSALVFFTILSTGLYFSLLQETKKRNYWPLIAANVIGLSFHFFFIFVVLTQWIHWAFLYIRFKAKPVLLKPLKALVLSVVISVLIYVPIFMPVYHGVVKGHLVPGFPLSMLEDLLDLKLNWIGAGEAALALIGWIFLRKRVIFLGLYFNILFVLSMLIWLSHPEILCSRYFGFLLPFLLLLITNGVFTVLNLSPKRIRPLTLSLLVGFSGLIIWQWESKPAKLVEDFKCFYREGVDFAQSLATPHTRFCAFGNEDSFFQFYSKRPVATFQTFNDFLTFYKQGGDVFCFALMGPPMTLEHKKIFLFLMTNAKAKNFDDIFVFYLN